MKLNLSIADRIKLLSLLPSEGDILTLKIVRDLQNQLSFSEDEHKALNLKQEGERVTWGASDSGPKEVEFGEKAQAILEKGFKTLSEAGKLRADMIDLYETFVKE